MPQRQRSPFSDLSPDTMGGIKRKANQPPKEARSRQRSSSSGDKTGNGATTTPTMEATPVMEHTEHRTHEHHDTTTRKTEGGKDWGTLQWSDNAQKDIQRILSTPGIDESTRNEKIQRVIDRELDLSANSFWKQMRDEAKDAVKFTFKAVVIGGTVYFVLSMLSQKSVEIVKSSPQSGSMPQAQ